KASDLETTLPVIFEAKKNEPWDDPAVWSRVNPGHGITIKHDDILEEAREAALEPRKRNDFERYHLNRWPSSASAWIPLEWWDNCEGALDDEHLCTLECAAGLDLAQKWDLAAFVIVFREYLEDAAATPIDVLAEDETGALVTKRVSLNFRLYVRPFFWIPENTLKQHEKQDGVPYSLWRDLGLVTATEGDVIDYSRIYRDITETILPRYPRLKQGTLGYDPAFATDLATKLRDLAGLPVLEVLQNYKMISEPAQTAEALIKGRRVTHDGHRVLRWNFENVAIKTDDAGRVRPVKPRNPAKRIDGAVAILMGERALDVPREREP